LIDLEDDPSVLHLLKSEERCIPYYAEAWIQQASVVDEVQAAFGRPAIPVFSFWNEVIFGRMSTLIGKAKAASDNLLDVRGKIRDAVGPEMWPLPRSLRALACFYNVFSEVSLSSQALHMKPRTLHSTSAEHWPSILRWLIYYPVCLPCLKVMQPVMFCIKWLWRGILIKIEGSVSTEAEDVAPTSHEALSTQPRATAVACHGPSSLQHEEIGRVRQVAQVLGTSEFATGSPALDGMERGETEGFESAGYNCETDVSARTSARAPGPTREMRERTQSGKKTWLGSKKDTKLVQ